MERIGVRELRQNASRYLDRVRRGETIEVTSHGQPVARLAPIAAGESLRERLISEGRLRPAERSLSELGPALRVALEGSVSDAVGELRSERLDRS